MQNAWQSAVMLWQVVSLFVCDVGGLTLLMALYRYDNIVTVYRCHLHTTPNLAVFESRLKAFLF